MNSNLIHNIHQRSLNKCYNGKLQRNKLHLRIRQKVAYTGNHQHLYGLVGVKEREIYLVKRKRKIRGQGFQYTKKSLLGCTD